MHVEGQAARVEPARVLRPLRRRDPAVYHEMGGLLGWPAHAMIPEVFDAASDCVREELEVETPLTIGVPVRAWRNKEIDATISVGPLECMPNKIAEAQFCHVAEKEGLLSLTLSPSGDPIDPEVLDNFAFEVHQRFKKRRAAEASATDEVPVKDGALVPAAEA